MAGLRVVVSFRGVHDNSLGFFLLGMGVKSTNVGVNMDVAQRVGGGIKIHSALSTRDYVQSKYDGLPVEMQKMILHPYFQTAMQEGRNY